MKRNLPIIMMACHFPVDLIPGRHSPIWAMLVFFRRHDEKKVIYLVDARLLRALSTLHFRFYSCFRCKQKH